MKSFTLKELSKNRMISGIKRAGVVLLSLLACLDVMSQNHDYNWIYASRWPDSISIITFTPYANHFYRYNPNKIIYTSTNATMSNSKGELIFSTNGCKIMDKNMEVMQNGDGLNPGELRVAQCSRGGYTAGHQSCLVLPRPGVDSQYALFHQIKTLFNDSSGVRKYSDLMYTIVDMKKGMGLEEVVEKNISIISDSSIYGGALTAVKHENNKDWWVVNPVQYDSSYYMWLLKKDTIIGIDAQRIGRFTDPYHQIGGGAQFTPDGTKYLRWNAADGIYIMEFDRSNGQLSNFQWIDHRIDSILFVGLAVSPNSRFLYTSADYTLYQYDLWASDIAASRVLIATYDGFRSPGSCTFWAGQLGPDCKIYFNSRGSCSWLHVIHKPNEKGTACDFRQHDFSIKSNHFGTMPHFPNYRLGTAPTCDSTLVATTIVLPSSPSPTVDIIPNPIWVLLPSRAISITIRSRFMI